MRDAAQNPWRRGHCAGLGAGFAIVPQWRARWPLDYPQQHTIKTLMAEARRLATTNSEVRAPMRARRSSVTLRREDEVQSRPRVRQIRLESSGGREVL